MDIERLEDRLAPYRDGVRERIPAFAAMIDRLAAELEDSVIRDAVGVGEEAPDFELPVAGSDRTVRLKDVLNRGPAVLSFYRGHW
jgi:hypothetical protein